ncbi:neurotactin-like isoform X2 [Homarus americanus]|uniref:Neurotactin-like 2 n=2 Tax=Homarus americanus TaxID=6706 RepID=A0A8J5N4J7_HOMAM|nr:neurotactin-like isoform X2 [Homarus americanus]XP_042214527.1 neurotactin-like isoform X2 [Homarus americanus]KAG7173165.1 Neurotactin-like 2 [Homarus americanus]
MSGVPVVGRYVSRSWSSGSGAAQRGGGDQRHQPSPPQRPRSPWRIPAFFRRKFEIAQRGGGRVASTAPGESEGGVAVTEEAFKDPPPTLKDPHKDPMRESTSTDPIKDFEATPSPYEEPEVCALSDDGDSIHRRLIKSSPIRQIRDVTFREPRYLDLFDPSVSVVRDPKLDLPKPASKSRAHSIFSRFLSSLASTKVIIACSIILVVLVVVIVTLASTSQGTFFSPDPRIQHPHVTTVTTCGPVQGTIQDGSYVFRGIPYAIPPLGKLRFRPAQLQTNLNDCWTGTYVANVTQPCWSYDSQGAVVEGSEDCLLIDVFTPQLGYDSPLPVIVFVGGASLGGDTQRPWLLTKAAGLAKTKRVVVLSPQVRRGLLGFFPHPKLAASTYPHTAGNQGVSDLLTALTWVQHNVEHFGGDPEQVTFLGHQAGAAMAWPLISSPQGHRLVHSAWVTGSVPLYPEIPWREADPELVDSLNCSTVMCLESIPARTVMEAPPLEWRHPQGRPWLLADGVIVPFLPSMPQVPLMIGSTEQAAAHFLLSWRERLGISHQQLLDAAVDGLRLNEVNYGQPVWSGSPAYGHVNWPGDKGGQNVWPQPPRNDESSELGSIIPGSAEAEAALEWYSNLKDDPWLLLTTLVSDATVTCPTLATAEKLSRTLSHNHPTGTEDVPVYAYVSRHARVSRAGAVADGLSDIESILGVFQSQTDKDVQYARTIQDLFFFFVNYGSPEWQSPTPAHLGVYMLDGNINVEHSRLQCEHWSNSSHLMRRF